MEPPSFTEYPRPQPSPSGLPPRPPGVYIEAISDAITLFQREWTNYVLATLIAGLIFFAVYVSGYIGIFIIAFAGGVASGGGDGMEIALILAAVAFALVLIFVQTSLYYGIAKMALKQIRGYPISLSDMFGAIRFSPRIVWAQILTSLAGMVAFIAFIVPGLWVYGGLAMAPYIIIDQDRGAMESMNMSFKATGSFGTAMSIFGMLLLIGMVAGCGAIACGVGLLVTAPIGIIATCIEYHYLFPQAFEPSPYAAP